MTGDCRESGFIGAKSCFWHDGVVALMDPSKLSSALVEMGVGEGGWSRFRAGSQQSPLFTEGTSSHASP